MTVDDKLTCLILSPPERRRGNGPEGLGHSPPGLYPESTSFNIQVLSTESTSAPPKFRSALDTGMPTRLYTAESYEQILTQPSDAWLGLHARKT